LLEKKKNASTASSRKTGVWKGPRRGRIHSARGRLRGAGSSIIGHAREGVEGDLLRRGFLLEKRKHREQSNHSKGEKESVVKGSSGVLVEGQGF